MSTVVCEKTHWDVTVPLLERADRRDCHDTFGKKCHRLCVPSMFCDLEVRVLYGP